MFLVYVVSLLMITTILFYDFFISNDADSNWVAGAFDSKTYFTIVFIFFTTSYSFILRPNNEKLALTFNQYRDLRIDDTA